MKTPILTAAALFLLTLAVSAQPYSIDWFKVAGGGGTSTGGNYSLSGTVGQADAGTMTGGQYGLIGGYWAIIGVVPTPGAPLLQIAKTATNTVIVWWPSPSTGFILQQNPVLGTTNWTTAPQIPVDNGTTKTIVVNPPVGNLFYRLKK
jgi:hypothetical protein